MRRTPQWVRDLESHGVSYDEFTALSRSVFDSHGLSFHYSAHRKYRCFTVSKFFPGAQPGECFWNCRRMDAGEAAAMVKDPSLLLKWADEQSARVRARIGGERV